MTIDHDAIEEKTAEVIYQDRFQYPFWSKLGDAPTGGE